MQIFLHFFSRYFILFLFFYGKSWAIEGKMWAIISKYLHFTPKIPTYIVGVAARYGAK